MKTGKVLMLLCITMGLIAGCALPVGDDYVISRNEGPGTTYITDYNLQSYVPIPNTGKPPVHAISNREDVEVKVLWKNAGGTEVPPPFKTFLGNTVYQAEITVAAKNGYGFYPAIAFVYPDGKITSQYDDLKKSTRHITVTYNNSDDADITFVTSYNLQKYVPIPLAGEKPVRNLTSREDLTLEAVWKAEQTAGSNNFVPIPDDEAYTFDIGTVYQAAIQLKAKPGYRFVQVMNFEYTAEPVITQYGLSTPKERNLTFTYIPTKSPKRITDQDLTPYVIKPAIGIIPLKGFGGTQYTGRVLWKDTAGTVLDGPFQGSTVYKAEVTLTPVMGYGFTGVGQDTFTHTDAAAINNPENSGIVTISFLPIRLTSFGPVSADGSVVKLLQEKKGESILTVDLHGGTEVVKGNSVTLTAGTNSPAQVIINGHNRVLTIEGDDRGKLLTVGKGVTLTLQNITLRGANKNDSPLVEVRNGGTLILKTGAVLKENQSSGDAGGVWVNGGKFIMNGGIIEKNTAQPNGQVVSGIGGGVLNTGGTFIMMDGVIQENGVTGSNNYGNAAGGVFNGGSFTLSGGNITGNTGGSDSTVNTGVFNSGTFTMTGPAKVAGNNLVELSTDKYITIGDDLKASSPVANIKYHDVILPDNTTQTLLSANAFLVTENYTKFYYDGKPDRISAEGKYIHPKQRSKR
jgi:hypothetical protein